MLNIRKSKREFRCAENANQMVQLTWLRIHSVKLPSNRWVKKKNRGRRTTHSRRQKICPHPTSFVTPSKASSLSFSFSSASLLLSAEFSPASASSASTLENGIKHIGHGSSRSTASFPRTGSEASRVFIRSWGDKRASCTSSYAAAAGSIEESLSREPI